MRPALIFVFFERLRVTFRVPGVAAVTLCEPGGGISMFGF